MEDEERSSAAKGKEEKIKPTPPKVLAPKSTRQREVFVTKRKLPPNGCARLGPSASALLFEFEELVRKKREEIERVKNKEAAEESVGLT